MMDLRKVAATYGGTGSGNQCNIPTPGHSKRDLGTSITIKPGAPDGVLVKCHNGSDADALAVKDMLRRDGFLPEREPREIGNDNGAGWRCTGTYEYDDGDGQVIYRTRRLERTGSKKRFVAERLEGGTWVSGLGDVHRLPYRFTELCKAAERARETGEPEPVIYFAEGERKADKLASWGFLATAIAFGCKGWREEYGEAFRGSTVIILPDNDEPGRAFAQTVKEGIEEYGGRAHVIELPGLPAGGDIMDWDGTADDLRALSDKALAGSLLPLPTLDLGEMAGRRAQAKRFVIELIAPEGEVTLFTGPGSGGKSLLAQQLATASAAAIGKCLGLDVQPGPSIYITCEDDAAQLHWRQEHICEALGVDMADLAGKLHLVSLRGALDNALGTFTPEGALKLAPAYHRLVAMIQATGARLVFLDNVAHLFAGNENDRGQVTRFVNLLNRLAGETGAAVVLLAHPNKSGDRYSGSTAWLNAVRSQVTINFVTGEDGTVVDPDARRLIVGKANYARNGDVIAFRWHNWAYVLDDDLPADARAEMDAAIKANGENAAFQRCLDACTDRKRAVSHHPGVNYYGSIFPKMPEGKGHSKEAFERAFERLLAIGAIELDAKLWQRENRAWKYGIRAVESAPTPLHQPPAPTRTEPSVKAARTDPLIPKGITGAATQAAAPEPEPCKACGGVGCAWCER